MQTFEKFGARKKLEGIKNKYNISPLINDIDGIALWNHRKDAEEDLKDRPELEIVRVILLIDD